MVLLFLKVFSSKIYTLLHALKLIFIALFSLQIRGLTASSSHENRLLRTDFEVNCRGTVLRMG